MTKRNEQLIHMRQSRNPYNFTSELFRHLTRIFSGPIVSYNRQVERSLRQKSLNKYKNKFWSTSGQAFKRTQYNPFEYLSMHTMVSHQRAQRYADFSQMEFNPDLGAALNVYADEISSHSHLEPILRIKCANEEIKEILTVLYYDILNIPHNLFGWARNMCKYGDFFLYLDIDEREGIKTVIGLPSEEIERLEGQDASNPNYIQFQWNAAGMTFENWQVAHFRILGNDKYVPYGQCIKDDTRIYTSEGIKEIKNITLKDTILSFDLETQKYRYSKILDVVCSGEKECYKLSTRHNFIEVSKEHKILIYDKKNGFLYKGVEDINIGNLLCIKRNYEIGENIKIDKSISKDMKHPGVENSLICVPDYINEEFAKLYGFMIGDGWIHNNNVCFALGVEKYINDYYIELLEKYSDRKICIEKDNNGREMHAICHSKMLTIIFNNLGFKGNCCSKRFPDWIFKAPKKIQESFLQGLYEADGSIYIDKWNCTRYSLELSNEQLIKDAKTLIQILGYKTGLISSRQRKAGGYNGGKKIISRKRSYYFYYFLSKNKQYKKYDNPYRSSDDYILEPVIKIEQKGIFPVYDIHIENENHNFVANGIVVHNSILDPARRIWREMELLEQAMMAYRVVRAPERKVFYIDVGNIPPEEVEQYIQKVISQTKRDVVVDGDSGRADLRYSATSVENDYYLPVRGAATGTRIESLPGGQYTGDIDDVKYLRDKLFSAIQIPMSYLSRGEAGTEDKESLVQKDIIFARTVQRLQRYLISELEKVGLIHLYINGFRGQDLLSFKLSLNNPSKIAELQELEHWRTKFDVASAATDGYFSRRWVAEKMFNMSDEEFRRNQRELFYDRVIDAELEAVSGEIEGGIAGEGAPKELDTGETFETTAEEEPEEGTLLTSPEEEEEEPGSAVVVEEEKEPYLTPGAKGKLYYPVKDDKRDIGARTRSFQSKYSKEKSSNTKRNILQGAAEIMSIMHELEKREKNRDNYNKHMLNEHNIEEVEREIEKSKNLLSEIKQHIDIRGKQLYGIPKRQYVKKDITTAVNNEDEYVIITEEDKEDQ